MSSTIRPSRRCLVSHILSEFPIDLAYNSAELEDIWRDVLLNQFHDVLPGTSIKLAIDDAVEIYVKREKQARILLEKAVDVLFRSNGSSEPTIIDPIRLSRNQVIDISSDFSGAAAQIFSDGSGLVHVKTQSDGSLALGACNLIAPTASSEGGIYTVVNSQFRLTISEGRLTSLYDIALERELIRPGPRVATAGLMLYQDLPLAYDAWDAEVYHLDCATEIAFTKVEIVAQGPLRASIRAEAVFGDSVVALTFSLDAIAADAPRSWIRVDVYADWHEKHKFLKCKYSHDAADPSRTPRRRQCAKRYLRDSTWPHRPAYSPQHYSRSGQIRGVRTHVCRRQRSGLWCGICQRVQIRLCGRRQRDEVSRYLTVLIQTVHVTILHRP